MTKEMKFFHLSSNVTREAKYKAISLFNGFFIAGYLGANAVEQSRVVGREIIEV